MARSVKVGLEAEVGKFIPPVEESAKATEKLKDKVEDLDQKLKKLPADSLKAAAALKLLGTEADGVGKKVAGVGDGSTSMLKLSDAVARTRAEVKRLADEFNRTGDVGVLGQLFSAQKDLKALEGLSKRVSGALQQGAADGGRLGGKAFTSAIAGFLSTPVLGPVLIGALAGVAAVVGGPGGILLGGLGLTGIAAGIIGQFRDPQVHQAFATMGHDLMTTLTAQTATFKQPLIDAAHTFGDTMDQVITGINFSSLSKMLEMLASGLSGMVGNIMPGFNKALAAAEPVLRAFAQALPMLGTAISDMFAMFAKGGKGAQESITMLVSMLAALAYGIGAIVLGGAKLTEWFVSAGAAITNFYQNLVPANSNIGKLFHGLHDVFDTLQNAGEVDTAGKAFTAMAADAALTAADLSKLESAFSLVSVEAGGAAFMTGKIFDAFMSVDQAILSVDTSLTKLSDSFKANGKSIDEHTAKGQANVTAIYQAVQANMAYYQAQIAAGMSASDAAASYDQNTAALERQLRKMGLTQAQIDGLIGKYRAIPDKVNTDIAVHGLTDALNNLGNLIARVNGLDGRSFGFTVTQTIVTSDQRTSIRGNRYGGIYQHAEQGLVSAKVFSPVSPARYAFAEPATGGEAFVPRHGDYGRSTAILDQASRWYGGRFAAMGGVSGGGGHGSTVNVAVTVNAGMGTDGAAVGRAIADKLRPYVAANGGNVQATLGRT